ncbi:MAG: T9SS type A sorting domain-containing protein, partial [Hymenobacter sp.]
EENFDYPSGTVLATSTTVADATTGWTAYNGTGTNNLATAADNQVQAQYPQGVLAATPAGTSTQVALALNGQDIYKSLAAPTVPDRYYVASVVNITTAQANGDYFLALYDNTSGGGTQRGRVFVRATTGGINFGVSVDAGTSAARYSSTVYSLNTPYLVVLRYETNGTAKATNDDVATLYVLDNSATPVNEPTTATATSGPSTGALAATNFLNAVALRQGSRSGAEASATLLLDGLRVATGWGAAVGRPVYTTSANTIAAGDYYSLRVAGVGTQVSTNGTVRLEKQLNLDGGQVVTSSTSPLVLRARPTIGDGFDILVNPGGTSYVDGPLAREAVGGPSLLFPIGRNGNYRPLTLNITSPPSGTTTYTAAQTEGTPADQTISEPLTRISRVRYFSVMPSPVPAAGVFTGTVTLSFGSDDDVTDPSVASFVVAKSDGAGWSSIGRGVNTASSLTSDTFQDFSDFSLASTAADVTINPLPVQLTSFAAARTASGVQVAWATASELGSDHFEVERSLNGTTFGRVASVPAQGNTTQAHRYTALDRSAPAALLYYRLRQVDRDGTVAYSPTVTVAAGAGATAEFALAPNPAHASLSFLTEAATAYTVRNPLGQAVRTGTTHPGTNTIAVEELPAGVYLFELHGSQGRVVRRFVK